MSRTRASLATGLLVLLASLPLAAANRLHFANETVPAGAAGLTAYLLADLDVEALGFSFGVTYVPARMEITAVDLNDTVISPFAPDFFDGRINATDGVVGYGCVLSFSAPFDEVIGPGVDLKLARVVYNALGAGGTTANLTPGTVAPQPPPARPVKCVFTDTSGNSLTPTLGAGTITFEDRSASITSLAGNSGEAGKVFQVVGQFLGEDGLAVKVCGVAAEATLRGDGVTLDVTAPACGSTGFAPVEVCNTWGCDTETNGFDYTEVVAGGLQVPSDCNQDGKADISDAVCLLGHLFTGNPEFLPCGDGTVSDPANRTLYNANGDASGADLSDAVYLLLFLFVGGPPPVLGLVCTPIEGCPTNAACAP